LSIVSALTPSLAHRSDFVRGVLPPEFPEGARAVLIAFGFAMIWLSRGLARRKQRAWGLALAVVVLSGAAHLITGFDTEEAVSTIGLMSALWMYRDSFSAPGDPEILAPLTRVLVALTAVTTLATIREFDTVRVSNRIEDALVLLGFVLTFRALYLWLRPVASLGTSDAAARARARALVRSRGRDSLAYFALRQDKDYLFSSTRRTFFAYRVVNGTALISGDPIGDPREMDELMREFKRIAHALGWRVAVLGASAEMVEVYRAHGFHSVYLGDEAVIRPAAFSLDGRPIRKVRQAVARARKHGYTSRLLRVGDADARLRAEIGEISSEWRGRWPERGFTMAMDALWTYPDSLLVIAEHTDGSVGGFLHLVPSQGGGGWSLATMRRRRETPNGLMEFLIVEAIEAAARHDVNEVSLNFAVFGRTLRCGHDAPRRVRALRVLLLRFDRLFQLDRLHRFSAKFFPEWRPRYVCIERWADAPVVGLAYLHVEQLLTPPGPWVQGRDLAAA
jgi:lysyl-tRNA synthetase, class II